MVRGGDASNDRCMVGRAWIAVLVAVVTVGCGSSSKDSPDAHAVHLSAYSDNDSGRTTVVVTGAIADFGVGERVRSGHGLRPGRSGLRLTLTEGSFLLDTTSIDHDLAAAFRTFPSNVVTCSGEVKVTGKTSVVPTSGTGRYRGSRGTVEVTVDVAEDLVRTPCDASSAVRAAGSQHAESVFLTGTGEIRVG
jgi:hypothetical protein